MNSDQGLRGRASAKSGHGRGARLPRLSEGSISLARDRRERRNASAILAESGNSPSARFEEPGPSARSMGDASKRSLRADGMPEPTDLSSEKHLRSTREIGYSLLFRGTALTNTRPFGKHTGEWDERTSNRHYRGSGLYQMEGFEIRERKRLARLSAIHPMNTFLGNSPESRWFFCPDTAEGTPFRPPR